MSSTPHAILPTAQLTALSQPENGPRKRRRATVACRSCRQRKTKCDHIVPAKAPDEMLRGMTKSAQVYIRSLERRVRNFEDTQRDARHHVQQSQQQTPSAPQSMTPAPAMSQYDMMVRQAQQPILTGWSTDRGQQQRQQQSQRYQTILPTTPDIFLSGKSGEAFTHLILVAMNHPSARIESQSFASPRATPSEAGSTRGNIYSLPANARELLRVYFDFHHELTPIFHVPSIMAQFEQIFEQGGSLRCPDHIYTLAILNMICALTSAHNRSSPEGSEAISRGYYDTAMQLMQPRLMSDWRVEKVQALLLGARYLQSSSYSDECWTVLGLAISIAYDLELHRPPDPEKFDFIEQEVRKRVWYACFGLDKLLSMIYGRPAATSTATFSTPLPEDLDDDCIRQTKLLFPSVQTTTSMSFFLQVSKLYRLLESTTMLGDQSTLSDLVKMDEEFEAWQTSVPPSLQIRDVTVQEDHKALILALRANMVCILIHRQSLVSGLSALCSSSSTSAHPTKGWEGGRLRTSMFQRSRQVCVSTAEETIRLVAQRHEQTKNSMGPSWFNLYYLFTSILTIVSHVVNPEFQEDRSALMHLDQAVHMIRQMSVNHLCAQRAYAFLQQLLSLLDRTLPENRRHIERYSTPPVVATGSSRGEEDINMYNANAADERNDAVEDGGVDLWSLWDITQDLTLDLGSQLELHSNLGSTWTWGIEEPSDQPLMESPSPVSGMPGS